MGHNVVQDYTTSTTVGEERLKVFLRARPLSDSTEPDKAMWVRESKGKISIKDTSKHVNEHAFLFDDVFWVDTQQQQIFDDVCKPLIEHVINGYNGCCFAYGQTGSGKTYSIFGEEGDARGIIPRAAEYVFSRVGVGDSTEVVVSFLEIYCDDMRDLGRAYVDRDSTEKKRAKSTSEWYLDKRQELMTQWRAPKGKNSGEETGEVEECVLDIKEDHEGNVYVRGLSEIVVTTPGEVIEIVKRGFAIRATHETTMNEHSSRSHAVFTISVIRKNSATGETTVGSLNFVDLAGSERLKKSGVKGQRLKEMLSINTSLSALGKVAMTLDPSTLASKGGHVPYRDSKLTRVLQNSMGGNSHTSVIATIHPTMTNFDECLATMHFANRCRNVVNQPRVNYVNNDPKFLLDRIKRLRAEVKKLRYAIKAIVAQKNKQLATVMAELGVKGQVMGDGRVQLESGKVLGKALDLAQIEKEGAKLAATSENASPAGATGGMSGENGARRADEFTPSAGATSPLVDAFDEDDDLMSLGSLSIDVGNVAVKPTTEQLTSPIALGSARSAELSFQAEQLKKKLKGERVVSKNLQKRLSFINTKMKKSELVAAREKAQSAERIKSLASKLSECQRKLAMTESKYEAEIDTLKSTQEKNLKAVYENTKTITEKSEKVLASLPFSVNETGEKLRGLQEKFAVHIDALQQKHEKALIELKASHNKQLENAKAQCKFFVARKDSELREFVEEFNAFQADRNRVLFEHRDELFELYKYCNQLTRFVNKLEKDDRRLRAIRRLGLQHVRVPKRDDATQKPDASMLRNASRFRLLRRNIIELDRFDVDADIIEADDDVDSYAEFEDMPPNSIRDRLNAKKQRQGQRPYSARVRVVESPTNGAKPRPRSAGARSPVHRRPELPSPTTVGEMDAEELRGVVETIRHDNGHASTSSRVEDLETDLGRARRDLEEEKVKYRNLRIAFNAQRRALKKAELSMGGLGSCRPSTAASTRSTTTRFSAYNSAAAVRRYLGYDV